MYYYVYEKNMKFFKNKGDNLESFKNSITFNIYILNILGEVWEE